MKLYIIGDAIYLGYGRVYVMKSYIMGVQFVYGYRRVYVV